MSKQFDLRVAKFGMITRGAGASFLGSTTPPSQGGRSQHPNPPNIAHTVSPRATKSGTITRGVKACYQRGGLQRLPKKFGTPPIPERFDLEQQYLVW